MGRILKWFRLFKKQSEWTLCDKCGSPWKYHEHVGGQHNYVFCPNRAKVASFDSESNN